MSTATAQEPPAPAVPTEDGPTEDGPTEDGVVAALKTVYDPEIPVDIYELGLIYNIRLAATGAVEVDMTLTAPGCPVAGSLPEEARRAVLTAPGVTEAKVTLVWDPPWTPDRLSEVARVQLDMF